MILHTITPWSLVKEQSPYMLFRQQSEDSSCPGGFKHSTYHQHLERQSPKRMPTELTQVRGPRRTQPLQWISRGNT